MKANAADPPEREVLFQESHGLDQPVALVINDSASSPATFRSKWFIRHSEPHADINVFMASRQFDCVWAKRGGAWLPKPCHREDGEHVMQLLIDAQWRLSVPGAWLDAPREESQYAAMLSVAALNIAVNARLNGLVSRADLQDLVRQLQIVLHVTWVTWQLPGALEKLPLDFSLRYGGLFLMNKPALRMLIDAAASSLP